MSIVVVRVKRDLYVTPPAVCPANADVTFLMGTVRVTNHFHLLGTERIPRMNSPGSTRTSWSCWGWWWFLSVDNLSGMELKNFMWIMSFKPHNSSAS